MLGMRKNCRRGGGVERCSDLCSATLEDLSYNKSISSACIYWPNSLNVVMLEAGLVSQCCAIN